MEYDKRNYQKTNDKKVLHKIRKHWVVVSTALLMALGGGAAATHVSANADTTANNGTATSASTLKDRMNQQLQTPQKQNSQARPAVNNNVNNSQNNNSQNSNVNIINQAKVLHNRILMNAGQNTNNSAQQSQTNGTSQNNVAAGQGRVAANAPKVNNNVHVNKVGAANNIAQRISANENNSTVTANDNNNQVDSTRRPRTLLGGSSNPFNGFAYDQTNQSYYLPYSYSDDPYGRSDEYGLVTVEYVDPSDDNRQIGGVVTDGPVLANGSQDTSFGTNNVQGYEKEIPQIRLGDGDDYGYSLAKSNPIASGQNITHYEAGENQYLVINVHRNPAPAKPGTIIISYLDADNNNMTVGMRVNSDKYNTEFDQNDYTHNVPNGYEYINKYSDGLRNQTMSSTNPITKYGNGTVQELHVYVAPVSKATTATVIYQDVQKDKSGNITSTNPVETMSINGNYGTNNSDKIPYSNLEEFVPSGYLFDKSDQPNTNTSAPNPTYFGSRAHHATVYIDVTKNNNQPTKPKDLSNSYGTITVHYKTAYNNPSDVETEELAEPNGTSFNGSYYDSKMPVGYSYAGTDTSTADSSTGATPPNTFKANEHQDYTVVVSRISSQSTHQPETDYIEYDAVDPNKPSDAPKKITAQGLTNPITITGMSNTKIDYTPYEKNLPGGYTFWTLGSHDPNYGSYETNHILLEKNDSLVGDTTVNYYDQAGQNIDDSADKVQINGSNAKYGDSFTAQQLANNDQLSDGDKLNHAVPQGYTLNSDEDGQQYRIDSDNQTINLFVKGAPVNPNHNDSRYDLWVNRIIKDKNGNEIGSDETPMPISGNNGDIITVNPNDYMPNPSSDYSLETSPKQSDQQVSIVPIYNGTGSDASTQYGIKGEDPHDSLTKIDPKAHKMVTTFTYVEDNATATVQYVDGSDGNNIVGSSVVNGIPNTPMSNYYDGSNGHLNEFLPYGFKYVSDRDGSAKLSNGATYDIDVANDHLACPGNNTLPDEGYINIVYGKNLKTDHQQIYSEVTTSNKVGDQFNVSAPIISTTNGGLMPDVYTNGSTADSAISSLDSTVVNSGYQSTPQTYYVDVDKNTSTEGQPVNDMIVYQALNSDGSLDTQVGNNSAHNNGIVSDLTIQGKDGQNIDYTPYKNNIPYHYAYYGQTKTNSSIYTKGMDSEGNPVAVVYVKTAHHSSTNTFPGYDPDNDVSHKSDITPTNPNGTPKNSKSTTNPNGVNPSDGTYYPFNMNASDVPVIPGVNPQDPITNFKGKMPDNYQSDNNGYVPTGYDPGWVSDGQGQYKAGYVPSDNIPSGYVPGLVPNGKGGYVAGYVPNDPKKMPQPGTKNGTDSNGKTIYVPKYVPGNIPNGHGGTTPGYVPDTPQYAKDSAGLLQIQYVDADDHNQVISDFLVGGAMGSSFDLDKSDGTASDGNRNYMKDLPYGYTNASDLGEEQKQGDISSSQKAPNDTYNYAASYRTINIAVHKIATGNVIYEDTDNNNVQVGSSQINGVTGDPVNFNSSSKYMQLLPYNYNTPTVDPQKTHYTNPTTLSNGATYVIGVKEAGHHGATPPQPIKNTGSIIVNYVDSTVKKQNADGTTSYPDIVGTDTFIGTQSDAIPNPANNDLGTTYVPWGYTNPNSTQVGAAQSATFNSQNTPQVFDIAVDPSRNGQQPKELTNVIGYQVVTKDGKTHQLVYGSKNSITYAGQPGATNKPVYFTVTGKEGTNINYAPYMANVPDGYEYDGMGNYSSTINKNHTSTTDPKSFDTILLRSDKPQTQTGHINITYYQNGNKYDTITVSGVGNAPFDQGYYEDDLPSDGTWQFAKASDPDTHSNIISQYKAGVTQNLNIYVKPATQPAAQFSNITIHFLNASNAAASGDNANTPDGTLQQQEPTQYVDETMSGHVGDLFSPQEYEYNTPTNTTFDHIIKGKDIDTFNGNNQNVWIAVNPTNNGNGTNPTTGM